MTHTYVANFLENLQPCWKLQIIHNLIKNKWDQINYLAALSVICDKFIGWDRLHPSNFVKITCLWSNDSITKWSGIILQHYFISRGNCVRSSRNQWRFLQPNTSNSECLLSNSNKDSTMVSGSFTVNSWRNLILKRSRYFSWVNTFDDFRKTWNEHQISGNQIINSYTGEKLHIKTYNIIQNKFVIIWKALN